VLFTDAHETTHALLPWHDDTLYVDDEGNPLTARSRTISRTRPTSTRR